MPKKVKVEGQVIMVPDDATPDEIDQVFKSSKQDRLQRTVTNLKAENARPLKEETNPLMAGAKHAFTSMIPGPSDAMSMAEDLGGAALGLGSMVIPHSLSDAAMGPGYIGKNVGEGIMASHKAAYDRSRAAADRGDTTESMIESVAAGMPLGPLASGIYGKDIGTGMSRMLQAASMAPKGSVIPNPMVEVAGSPMVAKTANAIRHPLETAADIVTRNKSVPSMMTAAVGKPSLLAEPTTGTPGPMVNMGTRIAAENPRSVADIGKIADAAKQTRAAHLDTMVKQAATEPVDVSGAKQAMIDSIPEYSMVENPKLLNRTADVADRFNPDTVESADAMRQGLNAKISGLKAKNPASQYAATESNPQIARAEAARSELRKAEYDAIQRATGEDVAPGQTEYGDLSEIAPAAHERALRLELGDTTPLEELPHGRYHAIRQALHWGPELLTGKSLSLSPNALVRASSRRMTLPDQIQADILRNRQRAYDLGIPGVALGSMGRER